MEEEKQSIPKSTMVKNGKVVHRAFDMGGFLYIICKADPSTMKTYEVNGEVTCKRCLKIKEWYPEYRFADGIHALKHPFCKKKDVWDGRGAGDHDGRQNLKKYLPDGLSEEFVKGYHEGYFDGQQRYTYHYKNGDEKERPKTNVPVRDFAAERKQREAKKTHIPNHKPYKPLKTAGSGCAVFLLIGAGSVVAIVQLIGKFI